MIPAPQRAACSAVHELQEGDQTQQAQGPQDGKDHDEQFGEVPEKPSGRAGGQQKVHGIVHTESGPGDPDEGLECS